MYALLLLPILVSGYIICRHHPVHSWRFRRYEGQRLYLEVCMYGLVSLAISMLVFMTPIGVWLLGWVAQHIASALKVIYGSLDGNDTASLRLSGFANFTFITSLSLLTPLVGLGWALGNSAKSAIKDYPHDWNLGWWKNSAKRIRRVQKRYGSSRAGKCAIGRYKRLSTEARKVRVLEKLRKSVEDSPLESFLFRAFLTKSLIQVSLKNDKVYVGIIIAMGEPEGGEAFKEITMLPMMSGYRDKDERQLFLSNDYPQFFADFSDGQDRMMEAIYVPKVEIYSYSGFDIKVYADVSGSELNEAAAVEQATP